MDFRRLAPALVVWLFPVVAIGVLAGLLYLILLATSVVIQTDEFGWRLLGMAVPLAIVIGLGVRAARRYRPELTEGVEVTRAEHPRLWAEVDDLAALAETAPPDRIVVVGGVDAAVAEIGNLRELVLGLPLLALLTRGQLRAVLAHEFGHFYGGDTAGLATIVRHQVFLDHMRLKAGPLWWPFFTGYAYLYALAAGPAARESEVRADLLSARAAGPCTAIEALRTAVRADLTWTILAEDYLGLFQLAGCRAPVREAMRRLLAANAADVEPAVDQALAQEKARVIDTHPPIRDRIARFEAAIRDGAGDPDSPDGARPAYELFAGGADWLDATDGLLVRERLPLASWDEVIVRGMRAQVDGEAEQTGARARAQGMGQGTLDDLLRLIDEPEDGIEPSDLVDVLFAPVLSALLAVGSARIVPSWTADAGVVASDGSDLDLAARLTAAVETRDRAGLSSWLAEAGVDAASARARSELPRWLAAMSHMTGPWDGRRDVHFWTTGVLALPLDEATVRENKDQVREHHQHARLYAACSSGLDAGCRAPGALWFDTAHLARVGKTRRLLKLQVTLTSIDGRTVEMSSTMETAFVDSPEAVADALDYLAAPKA